jgi:pyrimidine operon attenuation protein / uracil phosphoribosyltransferase
MKKPTKLLDVNEAKLKITRLAFEIYENNIHKVEIVLVGIASNGVSISKLLKKEIERISPIEILLATIEIDKTNPTSSSLICDTDLIGKHIIIVDDVINSGKTIFYTLKHFLTTASNQIQIAVLVDRKHKLYPIVADYVGIQLSTTLYEQVIVEIKKGTITSAFIK